MIFMIAVFLMLCNPWAFAATDLGALQDDEKKFVTGYVDAVNVKDPEKVKALVHSQSIACMNASNQDFFDDFLKKEFSHEIPDEYSVSFKGSSKDVEQLTAFALQLGLPYAVAPTHVVQIDYSEKQYSSVTILRGLAHDHGEFKMVWPCPSVETVEKFRRVKAKKEANALGVKKLYEELRDPLRSELTALIKDGKKIDAYKKYQEVTGESLAMAREVLNYLEE